jgi:predicted acylesterase/phospholipase RssA
LPLHAAVQASAAFPGGFPPQWIQTKPFGFRGGQNRPSPLPRLVALTDGGVYDNIAEQWPANVGERREASGLDLKVPDQLIVVNTSAGLAWSDVRRLRIPFVGELLALLRDITIMYDNPSSLRMQALVRQFRSWQHVEGALVYIEQSPYDIPEAYAKGDSPSARRAHAVLKKLGNSQAEWWSTTQQNMRVKTTLSRLGPEVTARLLRHGYVLAMTNLHVILDFPLVEIPETAEFMELVTSSKDPM